MSVSLIWQGPVGPGMFPNDPLMFENLCAAGVYVRVKTYHEARLVAYAGQSTVLLARFDQHLTAMLSLSTTLRDESGATIFTGDAESRLKAYGDLARASSLAAADAARVQFWYALCDDYFHDDHLNLVEGLLQRRIAERISDVENRAAAPGGMPDEAPNRWENDFSGLDAASLDVLTTLLGPDAMTTV